MSELPLHIGLSLLIDSESMASDLETEAVNLNGVGSYSIQAIWSAGTSPVGTLTLKGSNDGLTFSSIYSTPVAGNTGEILVNIEKPAYAHFKVTYVATGGTGTLNVYANYKR